MYQTVGHGTALGAASLSNVGDVGSISGSGRSPGGAHDSLLQYSFLENPMDIGTWLATVHRIVNSRT